MITLELDVAVPKIIWRQPIEIINKYLNEHNLILNRDYFTTYNAKNIDDYFVSMEYHFNEKVKFHEPIIKLLFI